MTVYTCVTCGAQYEGQRRAPDACRICEDDRQYVGHDGSGVQEWLSEDDLRDGPFVNTLERVDDDLWRVGTIAGLGIGQVAHLLIRKEGNVLWDCVPLVPSFLPAIHGLGGVKTIVISHPHFYTGAADWAAAFHCKVRRREGTEGMGKACLWVLIRHAD